MKVHILFPFRDGPWGGSNQFLSALRGEFEKAGLWAAEPDSADIVLFDSINIPWVVMGWKRRLPGIPFVQRIDGPISAYRGDGQAVDRLVYALGTALADAIVFQSDYSRTRNLALGMPAPRRWAQIRNAPRPDVFYPQPDKKLGVRIRIIATSWSSNARKGFEIYRYLDEHLDCTRYEMTFIGNSPIAFKNIVSLKPMEISELAVQLRAHDIFVAASRDDPCSNALAEALACGLPVAALSSGGHPELMGEGGELFHDGAGALAAIERISSNYDFYRRKIRTRSLASVMSEYLTLFELVLEVTRKPKALAFWSMALLTIQLVSYRVRQSARQRFNLLCSRGT